MVQRENRGQSKIGIAIAIIALIVSAFAAYYTYIQASATGINNELLREQNRILLTEQNLRLRPWIGRSDFTIVDILTEKSGWLGRAITRDIFEQKVRYNEPVWGKPLRYQLEFILLNYGSTPALAVQVAFVPKLDKFPQPSDLPAPGGMQAAMPSQKLFFGPTIPADMIESMLSGKHRLFVLVRVDYSYGINPLAEGKGFYHLLAQFTPEGNFVLDEKVA